MSGDAELLREFLTEGNENLDRLENELLAFEGNASAEMISAVFRTLHTVKGTAGFFGFEALQHVAHTAENLLSRIRDGELVMTSPIVSCLLDVVDAARTIMASIEATGGEGTVDHTALLAQLQALGGTIPGTEAPEEAPSPPPPPAPVAAPAPAPTPPPAPEPAPAAEHAPAERVRADTTIRVDTTLLDQLMDLAGELVLARNQLLQLSVLAGDPALGRVSQRLDAVTSKLQDGVMRTRMQPIGGAWAKFPRVVRDLTRELGKHARLEVEGEDTALDRSIIEAIKDPLTHLVRNAIDHGLETPDRRRAAGKPAEGVLRLAASHEGSHVAIEVSDDGGGIDSARVRRRAVERGVISAERAQRMTEAELVQLIFAPGFSTAEAVTSISGRGVGMDVVKTNVEAVGGTVVVRSTLGQGTTVRIDIPLTLAIIPALMLRCGGERYALPEAAISAILRIDTDDPHGIEYVRGAPVYRHRGELLPLIALGEVLAGAPRRPVELPAFVVIVSSDHRKFGIVIDDLDDSEEIVVKPLGRHLQKLQTYAGATILGDGRVALILDVRGIARRAGLTTADHEAATTAAVAPTARPRILLARGQHRQIALPLTEVSRLEEFAAHLVARSGAIDVVPYRKHLLPLVRVDNASREKLTVVIFSTGRRDLGLVVDSIVDVIDADVDLDTSSAMPGLRGSALVAGQVTDFIDVIELAAQAGLPVERRP